MKHFCEASYFDNTQPSNTAQASIGVDIREVNTSDPPVVLRLHRKSGPDRAADPAAQPTEVRMYANKMYKAEKTGLPEHLLVNCTYGTLKLLNDATTKWAFNYVRIDGLYWKRVHKEQAEKVLVGLAELFDETPPRPGCIDLTV